jgi:hypothetical protein
MRNVWENALYNLRNSARFHPQNASNPISGTLYMFQNIPGWYCLRNATASKCKVYSARYHKEEERWKLLLNYKSMAMVHNYAHFRVFVTRDWSWHKYLINMCDKALVCTGFPTDLDPSQNGPPGPNPPANMDRAIRYPLANMGQDGSWFALRNHEPITLRNLLVRARLQDENHRGGWGEGRGTPLPCNCHLHVSYMAMESFVNTAF